MGSNDVAPPSSTANISSVIVPRMIGLAKTNLKPPCEPAVDST